MPKEIKTWLIGYDKVRITNQHEAGAREAELHKSPGRVRAWIHRRFGNEDYPIAKKATQDSFLLTSAFGPLAA
jgi:hypothetical protein